MSYICGIIDFHKTPSDKAVLLMSGSAEKKALYPAVFINRYMTVTYDRECGMAVHFAKNGKYTLLCKSFFAEDIIHTYEKNRGLSEKHSMGNEFHILYDSERKRVCLGKGNELSKIYYTFSGSSLVFASDIRSIVALPFVRSFSNSDEFHEISELEGEGMEFSSRGLFYTD